LKSYIALVVGMGVVTYIPRMLPMTVLKRVTIAPRLRRFLENIPYAMLGALIFPGILTVNENPLVGALAGLICVVLGLLRIPLLGILFGGILAMMVLQIVF
jgi:branched-subunit amino acid transport protein